MYRSKSFYPRTNSRMYPPRQTSTILVLAAFAQIHYFNHNNPLLPAGPLFPAQQPSTTPGVSVSSTTALCYPQDREETVAAAEAPAGYRRSYADADIIPRGPGLKYRESLREVNRDKYRNQKPRPDDDDLSDEDAWYGAGKQYKQRQFTAPASQGYARPVEQAFRPTPATRAPPPPALQPGKGQGKRLPPSNPASNPPTEEGPPGYSQRPTEFQAHINERYGNM